MYLPSISNMIPVLPIEIEHRLENFDIIFFNSICVKESKVAIIWKVFKKFQHFKFEKDGYLLNPYYILLCKCNTIFILLLLSNVHNFEHIFFPTKKR